MVVQHFAPNLASMSLLSVADPGSEKLFRKELLIATAIHRGGGPAPDFDRLHYPSKKPIFGRTYAVDFLSLIFARLYGTEIVSRWIDGVERPNLNALADIDVEWAFKYNPLFLDDIPAAVRETALRRLAEAGVAQFADRDWTHDRALRELMPTHYAFPASSEASRAS